MFTTIAASVLINLAVLVLFYMKFVAPPSRRDVDPRDMDSLKSDLADLLTDLNHVANTHVNAIESRKEELMRVLEAANRKIVRINSLISDLQIMEGRFASAPPPSMSRPNEEFSRREAFRDERPARNAEPRTREKEIPTAREPLSFSTPSRSRDQEERREREESSRGREIVREVRRPEGPLSSAGNVVSPPQFAASSSFSGSPSAGTERERKVQTIIRLAREGWGAEDIAAHVRMSVHQVRQVLGLSGQERRV